MQLACEHKRILVGYLKLFGRFMSVMMVQTK